MYHAPYIMHHCRTDSASVENISKSFLLPAIVNATFIYWSRVDKGIMGYFDVWCSCKLHIQMKINRDTYLTYMLVELDVDTISPVKVKVSQLCLLAEPWLQQSGKTVSYLHLVSKKTTVLRNLLNLMDAG